MQHADLLDAVRRQVREVFKKQGAVNLDDCCETILIRDGFYCGRCFNFGNRRAIWFVEEKVIKFYGEDGEFAASLGTDNLPRTGSAVA